MDKPILDPCCGGRKFWFDKQNPSVMFCDCREVQKKIIGTGRNARKFEVVPDMEIDFTNMPFDRESFWHIVFDPPHLAHDAGDNSYLAEYYGKLPKGDWRTFIKAGFDECWRVLKPYGTLIFKWYEEEATVGEIVKCIGRKPLYGHKSGKQQKTHWLAFVKLPEVKDV